MGALLIIAAGSASLWRHRRIAGNPALRHPRHVRDAYFLLFEMLGPVIELVAYVLLPLSALTGLLDLGRRDRGWGALRRRGFRPAPGTR